MVDVDRIKTVAKIRGIKLSHICQELGEDPSYLEIGRASCRERVSIKV